MGWLFFLGKTKRRWEMKKLFTLYASIFVCVFCFSAKADSGIYACIRFPNLNFLPVYSFCKKNQNKIASYKYTGKNWTQYSKCMYFSFAKYWSSWLGLSKKEIQQGLDKISQYSICHPKLRKYFLHAKRLRRKCEKIFQDKILKRFEKYFYRSQKRMVKIRKGLYLFRGEFCAR